MQKLKNAALVLFSVVVATLLAEVVLRLVFKVRPGIHDATASFTPVDSLYELRGFYADSAGIFRVHPNTVNEVNIRIANADKNGEGHLYDWRTEVHEIYSLTDNLRDFKKGVVNNEFAKSYNAIRNKKQLTQFDTAFLHYAERPLNKDGFCSIPFEVIKGGKKKVLLLGDSFTWGRTVQNITSSFANILLAKGYVAFNTGISGADVTQYNALAAKYIPLLKPDVVIVNFFMGNDISYTPRNLTPYQPVFYCTNAGYLYSSPLGAYLSGGMQETYRFILTEASIPQTNGFNRFCSLTATGTALWRVMLKWGKVSNHHPEHDVYRDSANATPSTEPLCNNELKEIIEVSEANGAKCIVVAIPDLRPGGNADPKSVPGLFKGVPYVVSPVRSDGYSLADGHFNDAGHYRYALFLDSLLRL